MSLNIERYERIFLYLTVVVLVGAIVAIVLHIGESGASLPDAEGRIDVDKVRETAPFDNPGVIETAPGEYEAVIIAQQFFFEPGEITVPAGSEVTFIVTSVDVIHGFQVWDTAINAMVIPGQITRITGTFEEAGEFNLVCHEFCGSAHHAMFGKVVVTE